MFHKTYTANAIRNGEVIGSFSIKSPFWYSAYDSWELMVEMANSKNAKICDFRRVK